MAEIASFGVDVDENTKLAQNAQDTASKAGTGIGNLNDPNKLTPAEKAMLKRKYDTDVILYGMDTKKLTDAQLSTAEIDSAMNAITTYMTPFFADMTTTDTVDRDTLNTVFSNFDTADKNSDDSVTDMVSNAAKGAKEAGAQVSAVASDASVQASVAISNANAAQSSAMAAANQAGFASDTSLQASQAASSAVAAANEAATGVTAAKSDAANALTSAATALNTANGAKDSAGVAIDNAQSALDKFNNLNGGGRNYFLDSKTNTITPPGTANWDWRILITDDFWKNPDRLKSNNIKISFTLSAQKALTTGFNSKLYFCATPWPALPFSYPTGTTAPQKYELVFNITDSAYKTDNCFIRFQAKDTSDFPFVLENAKLEIGTTFTDWTPAPEDVQVQISDINGELVSKVSKDTYDSLAGTVDQVSTLSKQNQSALVTKADSQTVDTLKQRVTTAENTLTQTATKTELQQTETDVDKLNNSVNTNASNITAQAGKIDGLLTSTTDINGKLTTLQGSFDLSSQQLSTTMSKVDGQTTSINNLQADSSGFKAQFTTVNNTLGKQTTDIGTLQATSKSLSANFDSLSSDNKTNQHDIGQLQASAKGFSSTLETVQTQVQNSAVGTNLFSQSTATGGYVIGTTGDINPPSTTTNENVSDYISVMASSNYTFQMWGTTPSGAYYWYGIGLYDSDKKFISRIGTAGHVQTSDTAEYVSKTLTTTSTTAYVRVSFRKYNNYKVKLEKGSVATDWCPNPADNATVTALTQVKQAADGAQVLATDNQGDIASLQITAKGLQSSVNSKASSDQLTQLSYQLTNQITTASNDASSKMVQTINSAGIGFKNPDGTTYTFSLSAGGTALMDFNKIMLNGQTNIQSGTIGTAQIADAAITNEKVGSVDAGKITTGIMDASHINVDQLIANGINGKTITGIVVNTPTLNLGLNGTFTESYDYTQETGWFLPKKASGDVTFNHGVIEDQGTMQSYVNGVWGGMNDSSRFTAGMTNNVWTEYAPGYYKIDMYKQGSTTNVLQRTYADPTGFYYTSKSGDNSYLGNVLSTPQVQTGGVLTKYIGPGKGALRLQIGQNGKHSGLEVGSYAGKEAVLSDFIYSSTSSHSPNVHITENGHLVRTTSASKYKYNIKNPDIETTLGDRLLNVHLATWNDKYAVDSYAEQLSTGEEREKSSIDKYYGLIAEQLRDAGLDMFISYGKNHEIEGIQYDRAWVPLLSVIRRLNDKVNEYELRLSKLEGVSK